MGEHSDVPRAPDHRPGADDAALYRRELERLRRATQDLRAAYHERESQLERARREAREARQAYERLRGHRSVQALLKAAELTRGARRAGGGGAASTPPAAGEDGEWRPRPVLRPQALGPEAFRTRLRRRVTGEPSGEPLEVAVAGHGAAALAGVLDGLPAGWRTQAVARTTQGRYHCPSTADVVVVCSPDVDGGDLSGHPVRVALVGGEVDGWLASGWFDDLDVVVTVGEGADALARAVRERSAKVATALTGGGVAEGVQAALLAWTLATRVSLAVATPSRDVAEWWGDTHFGRALQRQFERQGRPTRMYLRETYSSPDLVRADVALHLVGLAAPRPQYGQVNVLWCISHPERLTPERCRPYDLVLVASERFAAQLTPAVDPPVVPLPQATDPERFHPDPRGPAHDLLFVGNSRRQRRTIIDDLTPTPHDLAVYGGDWTPDLLDPRHLRGEVVPNAELHRYYASAKIVLNDHWPEMARLGFVSNRIYDALAAGALVVSDPVEGIERAFDGAVLTYRGRDELRGLVDRYLADEPARRALTERGRRAVLERHTFGHRVERVLELLEPFLAVRKAAAGDG